MEIDSKFNGRFRKEKIIWKWYQDGRYLVKKKWTMKTQSRYFSDMIQNFDYDIPKWKEDCGMSKLLECQREACYKAIAALNAVVE